MFGKNTNPNGATKGVAGGGPASSGTGAPPDSAGSAPLKVTMAKGPFDKPAAVEMTDVDIEEGGASPWGPREKALWAKAQAFDFGGTSRFSKALEAHADVIQVPLKDILATEYKKFMFLHYFHTEVVPSKDIDVMWNLHTLIDPEYRAFCNVVFGEYLNRPERPNNDKYVDTLDLYYSYFGVIPAESKQIWPTNARIPHSRSQLLLENAAVIREELPNPATIAIVTVVCLVCTGGTAGALTLIVLAIINNSVALGIASAVMLVLLMLMILFGVAIYVRTGTCCKTSTPGRDGADSDPEEDEPRSSPKPTVSKRVAK